MSRPLRLLQVAPFPVLPPRAGGKIRIVQLARALSDLGVEVTVMAPYHPTQRAALAGREPFALLQVPYPFLPHFLLTGRPLPYGTLVSFHPGYRALLPLDLGSFDVCQLEHPAFVDLLDAVPPSTHVVYDAQNVEFDYVRSESRAGWVRRISGRRMRRLEGRLLARADHVFACSERDRRRFGELYGASHDLVSLLPNGIGLADVDAARRGDPPKPLPSGTRARALFTGSAVVHNHAAVEALLSRIAPALGDDVEIVVLGACARRFRRRRRPNLRLDPGGALRDYSVPGAVGLNPVVQGSGSSLKLLDYLAHGLPVLSTPFGLRGFEDLAPYVTTAALDEFPAALQSGPALPPGARAALARYEWRRVAADALRVYRRLACAGAGDGDVRV